MEQSNIFQVASLVSTDIGNPPCLLGFQSCKVFFFQGYGFTLHRGLGVPCVNFFVGKELFAATPKVAVTFGRTSEYRTYCGFKP